MGEGITYVGIDAHKKDLFIARLVGDEPVPVTWQLANEAAAVRRLVRKLEREAPGPVRVFYEAGPCGYALQRQVTTARVLVAERSFSLALPMLVASAGTYAVSEGPQRDLDAQGW